MTRRATRLALLVAFPIALVHELAHYFSALPWADDSVMLLDPAGGRATTYVDFRPDAPRWAVAVSCVFPTLLGAALGVAALLWWGLAGLALPADLLGWMRLSIAAMAWGVFSWPSGDDLEAARNGPEEGGSEPVTPGGEG